MCPKSPALPGTPLLVKDGIHAFDSRHQLQLKHLCLKRRGVSFYVRLGLGGVCFVMEQAFFGGSAEGFLFILYL